MKQTWNCCLNSRMSKAVISWLLVLVVMIGLLPVGMTPSAAATGTEDLPAGNTLSVEEADELLVANTGKTLVELALENDLYHFDTIDLCGGNSHLQGICVDDELKYMYFSYTSALAKLDMQTGEVVASIGGFGGGSFGTNGGAHLGCLAYYDGWVYGSLEYKSPGKKFFVAAFDTSKITEKGMSIQDEGFDNSIVTGILLKEPTEDFRDPVDTTVFTGQDEYGHATNEANNGHRFACSGIDGVTFGTMPGDKSGKVYMIVAYGVYAFSNVNRYDNTYNVLQFYDLDDFWDSENHKPTGSQNISFTYARGLSLDYQESEVLAADDTLYVYTGNTSYGSQNIEYEWDTGDIVLYTYGNTDGMGSSMYVVDGSKAPQTKILELGQNNTLTDEAQSAYAKAIADAYSTDINNNGTIEDSERLTGKVAVLKCVCGNEEAHSAETVGDATWSTTGVKKAEQPICSRSNPYSSTTGIVWIGPDPTDSSVDYFYIADGSYTASLYKRTTNANGSMSYSIMTPSIDTTAKELLHYSMDTEDLYTDSNGDVRLKNSAAFGSDYDAIVEGTASGVGVSGGEGSALSFDATKYPSQVDQVYLSDETIAYINKEIDAATGYGNYSYSFWAKLKVGVNSDGNFDPFIGFYRSDGTYAGVFEQRWRKYMKYVVNGVGTATVGAPGDSGAYYGSSSTNIPDDEEWHFFTVTENTGSGVLYMDGVQKGTYSVTTSHLRDDPITDFVIGGGVAKLWLDRNNRGRLIGEIDDVTIYAGILTADEVVAAYAQKPGDAKTNPVHPGVDTTVSTAAEFSPAYPVYDLTDDKDQTLTVTAKKAVSEVFTLDGTQVAISDKTLTFSAAYLETLECGITKLTLKYADGTTGTLELTVTDRQVPVLQYTFAKDAVTGNAVKDTSAYGVDAIANNITAFDKDHLSDANGAIVFNGYDYNEPTYVKLSDENAAWLNSVLKNGYTINVWAKATGENGNKMTFLGLYAEDARPVGALETFDTNETTGTDSIATDGVMTIRSHVGVNGNVSTTGYSQAAVSGTTVATNTWDMYTVSYTEEAGLTLYINGTQVANTAITADVLGQIDQFFIGHQYQKYYYNNSSDSNDWTTRGGFYGAMDDLSVYNYALSTDEITTLYGGGSITPAQKAKPIVHWTMDANTLSGDGTILESSNGYTSYYQNVTPVAGVDGKAGGALYFDGTADSGEWSRVWLGEEGIQAVNEQMGNQVTMSFWMKADTTQTNDQLAYTAAWSPVAGIYGTDTRFLMVAEYRNSTLHYCATIPGLNDQRITKNTITPANDQWYFVVMTWDGNTKETVANTESVLRRLYVFKPDGTVVVGTPDRAAATSNTNTGKLFDSIGHIEVGGQNSKGYWADTNVRGRFVGAIDDVKIYNIPFAQSDAQTMYENKPVTNNELYLPDYQFEVGISDASDLTFRVENAGELTAVSGMASGQFSMKDGVVTLDHEALVDLGLGKHLLTLTFANGARVIRVNVEDDREYFNADTTIFDKAAPADMTFSTKASFAAAPASVEADGLTAEDYSLEGRTVTIKKDFLMQQQPGAVEFAVTSETGETRVMTLNVTNTVSNDTTEPYPILYYKMDGADMVVGVPPVNGAAAGIIKDHSGNGVDLQYGGLTKTNQNADGTANSAIFFDGYRDYDVSRAWLDEDGMEYLKDAVDDQITISFWHKSDRITSNYMPAMGVFAEDNRPLVLAEFRDSGVERTTIGTEATTPTLTATPAGSISQSDGVLQASSQVTMNSTWHHYVVVYDGGTGASTLYVDGKVAAAGTLAKDQLADLAKFEIGGLTNASYYKISTPSTQSYGRLYGDLDEIKVYNVALTADDVAAVYEMGVSSDLPKDTTGVKVLASIAVTSLPKTSYAVNESLDVTGGKVTLTYTDGSAKVIDLTDDMVSGFDSSKGVEDQELTVTYALNGVTCTDTYTVDIVKALKEIQVSKLPDKTVYEVNEALNLTGGEVTLTYDDGSTETIALTDSTVQVTGFDSSTGGGKLLTVTYGGKTTTLGLTVGKRLASIAVTSLPKTSYAVNESLDVSGGKVTLTYNDNSMETIDLDAGMVTGFDSKLGATITLTVTFGDQTCTYDVTVQKALSSIKVSNLTTSYRVGASLNVAGATVTKVYDDGTEETIALTEEMVSGFDSSAAGTNTITITCEGKTATVPLTIRSASSGSSSGSSSSGAGYSVKNGTSKNGEVSISTNRAEEDETVTITVKPDAGYELDTLKVVDQNGNQIKVTEKNGKYTFKMPDCAVTVTATFAKETVKNPFVDVPEGAYFADAVIWATEEGITSGKTDTTFDPYTTCTRAQTVTFLWRAAGCPKPESDVNPFQDVKEGAYYYDAVLWAVENGITKGVTETTFSPNATVTRAQVVTFQWRAEQKPAAETLNVFTDVKAGTYYYDAVQWAVENGITNGTTATTFAPNSGCTRAQIVTFLYRHLAD